MIQALLFVVFSFILLPVSWKSLGNRRVHGFYRFFAFELILALIILNAEVWFDDPWSPRQLVSWLLLLASIVLVVMGFGSLRSVGKPVGDFESTTRLVTVGLYQYVRHPMYSSLLFLVWGTYLKQPSLPGLVLAGLGTGFLYATARVEEQENITKFGPAYEEYMKTTRRFIPFLF